jgi:hypothetical protein
VNNVNQIEARWNGNTREARMRILARVDQQMEYKWLKFWAGRSWKDLSSEIQDALKRWA